MINVLALSKSTQILLITGSIILIIVSLIAIIFLLNKLSNNKKKEEYYNEESVKEFLSEVKTNMPEENKEVKIEKIEPKIEKIEDVKVETNIKKDTENKFDLGEIAKQIEQDIENSNVNLTEYEMEQEERSIISYNELKSLVVEQQKDNDVKTVHIENEEPQISLIKETKQEANFNTEVLDFSELEEENIQQDDIEIKIPFKKSEFISPIDGVVTNKPMFEETNILELDKIQPDVLNSDDFLRALKDLRDSLE